jgi:uncharacterized protein with FMN-binding domain
MDTKKIIVGAATIAVVGGAGYYLSNADKQPESNEAATSQANGGSKASGSKYKDGTYKAEASYNTPGAPDGQIIGISVTLAGDKITDSTFTGTPGAGQADKFNQERFAKGFKQEVVGKSIDEVKLDVVNGSSLTPHAFMDALDKIKVEAKAN